MTALSAPGIVASASFARFPFRASSTTRCLCSTSTWAAILAAEKGNTYAQFNLAGLYASGTGVKRDLRKAYSLFALAGKRLDVTQQLKEVSSQLAREDSASQLAVSHE